MQKISAESNLLDFDISERPGKGLLAGVDEVGRGPLAGPVVAAAIVFFKHSHLEGLTDSKKVTPKKREKLYLEIPKVACIGIGYVSESIIDEINIYQATRLAMKRAVLALNCTPEKMLIDGNMKLDLPIHQKAVIKGDQKSAAIAAASVMAKVCRDAWMTRLDKAYPGYGLASHKGYGTAEHLKAIREKGPLPIHRKTFSPISQFGKNGGCS